jgi:hypothetical protein
MKIKYILLLAFTITSLTANAQIFKKIKQAVGLEESGEFTEDEAGQGIKGALNIGIKKAVEEVSQVDGYFLNPEIKIPIPEEAKGAEKKLRAIGLGGEVDKAVESINRAAEDAAQEALPIFLDAIKELTITDAINIVSGKEDAATTFLKRSTSDDLTAKFQPIIKVSLEKVDATKYWKDIMTAHNRLPFVKKINPDLEEYATQKAIEGLFIMVAKEELEIRKNPKARTTAILQKVFG